MSSQPGERLGVLCVGTIVADVRKVIDAYPEPDHLATIEEVSLSTGGAALNLAVDMRSLGATFPISLSGAVGGDEHGAFILDECWRSSIDTDGVQRIAGAITSFTDAMVERDGGRRTFFQHHGANGLFDASGTDIEGSSARVLHAGAPGLHPLLDAPVPGGGNGWSRLFERGQAAGLQTNMELVSIDPATVAELATPCLPRLDSIIVNELEAGAITGVDTEAPEADGWVDWATMDTVAGKLIDLGVAVIAVVHFPAGCVAATADGRCWRQGSVRVEREQIANTTGAGDAFAAGVMLGLHDGWPVEECLRLGAASAAACVRSASTSGGMERAEICLSEANRIGYRRTDTS
jgi:sugar/nucleoside kinase (ribokinase family)